MRILQILPELNVGGVETGTVDLAKYLIENGHHSVVVSHGGPLVADLDKVGSKHYILPVHKKNLLTMVLSVKKLRAIIRKENIDIVHARSRVPGWIAYLACRGTHAAFITTCHGYYSKNLFGHVMGWSKLIIVPSEIIGRHMIEDFGVSAESIRRIPRSVDLSRFSKRRTTKKSDPSPVIAIIGRITPLKGHTYFLKAMAKVIRSVPNARIWVIGSAPRKKESYRQELEILVRRLGLSDYVEFLGNRKDIPHLLSKVDVLVFSSIVPESFGRVILEAHAARVPVVATKVGGVVEIIDHEETGLMVLPKDTDNMASAVVRLIRDKDLRARFISAATKKLESKFTLAHMASRTVEVYEELLDTVNILVIKISSIGDVILSTASLKALRDRYPKSRIHCLVGEQSQKILQHCPYIDGLIVFDPHHKDKGMLRTLRLANRIRKHKFDFVIDFQNNQKSHIFAALSFARETFGYRNKKLGFLLSRPVEKPDHSLAPVEHQFQVLNMLEMKYDSNSRLELWPSEQDKEYVEELLGSEWLGADSTMVGINIAASEKWESKNWPIEHIAKLCDILTNQNIRVFITGIDKDNDRAKELLGLTNAKLANFVGRTDILQLAVLIQKCKVFVTPDSAPMHVAAAVGTPFVALFGPTDYRRHLPPAQDYKVFEKEMNCQPCYSQSCKIGTHDCLVDITPEEVAEEVQRLMSVKEQGSVKEFQNKL